jgi:YVTN family beta-propeller protein
MRFSKFLAAPLLALLVLTGCDPGDDTTVVPTPDTTSVFVINEGNFNRNNASISLFDKTTNAVTNDLFRSVNNRALGDVAQSMAVQGSRAYLVVNNSNKVEVVSLPNFQSVGVVQGLNSPRYFLPISATRAYVTQWGNFGSVRPGIKVIDLASNVVVDSIATDALPERLVLASGKVFVANAGSNTLTVIDPATNRVTSTLVVGDAPNSLAVDKNGLLWVVCGGTVAYTPSYDVDYTATTPGKLVSVNATTAAVASTRTFASNRLQPTDLHLNGAGDELYFRAADAGTYTGPVFRLGIAETALPVLTAPFIRRAFYGLNVDPRTGIIYGGTGVFQGTDKLIRYQNNGTPLDSATVGIGPNGFVFY